MPESLQCSERGETMEQNIDYFDKVISNLEWILDEAEKDISIIINSINVVISMLLNIE